MTKMTAFLLALLFGGGTITAQSLSRTFEMRQFTQDPAANGETDFKGETEWMDTEDRIRFLHHYADFASRFFNNPRLDKTIVNDQEIDSMLVSLKPQPQPSVRKDIDLRTWKVYGYRNGQDSERTTIHSIWSQEQGVEIHEGILTMKDTRLYRNTGNMNWRFKWTAQVKLGKESQFSLMMSDGNQSAILFRVDHGGVDGADQTGKLSLVRDNGDWIDMMVEGDLAEQRYNLYINGDRVYDFIPLPISVDNITIMEMASEGTVEIDELRLIHYRPHGDDRMPFIPEIIFNLDFDEKQEPKGWTTRHFDDRLWKEVRLPAVHGGMLEAGEALYLRTEVEVGDFERATLSIESLDPGGEVWINGEVAAVIDKRHPQVLDVTRYLKPHTSNILAVKVRPYRSNIPMLHAPADRNIGWFLDETKLILSSQSMITGVDVFTREIGEVALQSNTVRIHYPRSTYFEGSVTVNYYPWFPEEGEMVASVTRPVQIRPRIENIIKIDLPVSDFHLWEIDRPFLYKVEVILRDPSGAVVDDMVVTTGIRTIDQRGGYLYINGKVDMLNGVQIMGFRTPVENLAKYNRCPPDEIVAEEMLMVQKMGANLLRIHVHAEKDTADGVNDIRYARMADQMGIYLIWSTAGFIREGEAWNVDFDGYPKYMSRVFNHPSIVMWEASNHPNRFKRHDISDSHDYIEKIYNIIYERDPSRLISPTSFWQHTHYGNYRGDTTYDGHSMEPVPSYHAHRMTRGSQDAYTGYGAEWTRLRNAPNDWAASCLAAGEKAYFNFEHEESAAQPNWNLSRGKPWYKVQSYEWPYEEGSIGRKLQPEEWRASQAWQAFAAWESMKKQMLLGYDGFSWCCLRGGANSGTYQKPLIDNLRHPKLAYYINKMVFQRTWAGSDDVDVVYGPGDEIVPVIHHLGPPTQVDLRVKLVDGNNQELERKEFKDVNLGEGRDVVRLPSFRFQNMDDGYGYIVYELISK